MKYKLLGNSGLRISELSLGTMTFGTEWGWGSDQSLSRQVLDAYVEAGGNFIDTANLYTNGTSEKYLGEFMLGDREKYVLASKYVLSMNPKDANASGSHRKNLVQSIEHSLRRLKTDYIDLFWVHMYDRYTPLEEMMRALDDLVRMGKILYVGVSDFPSWAVAKSNTIAEFRGWSPFVGLQIEYSLAERTVERELLPMADEYGLSVLAWGPLKGGLLTGKFNDPSRAPQNARGSIDDYVKSNPNGLNIAKKVVEVAQGRGSTPSQVALRWLLQKGKNVIPILGARNIDQIKDNLACLDFSLSEEEMKILDEVSHVSLGFPQDFLRRELVEAKIRGDFDIQI